MVLVGCQTTSINGRLKRHLVNLVQDLDQKNSFYLPNIKAIKFASTATLKEDIVRICNCLYESASTVRVSLGKCTTLLIVVLHTFCCIQGQKLSPNYLKT